MVLVTLLAVLYNHIEGAMRFTQNPLQIRCRSSVSKSLEIKRAERELLVILPDKACMPVCSIHVALYRHAQMSAETNSCFVAVHLATFCSASASGGKAYPYRVL